MTQTAGIGAAAPKDVNAERLANLSKARATAAANRRARAAAAQSIDGGNDDDDPPGGVSAARQVQQARPGTQRPGSVIGQTPAGRVIVIGRDGKPISRQGDRNADKFAIPKNEIPTGWSYQWIAETVLNEPQTAAMMDFQQKQWTPVPQERHPTRPVRQGGLVLVERPTVLTEEARQEEMQEAKDQVRANIEQFTPGKGLPKTGHVRKGRPVSVDEDGVSAPVLEVADDE